MAGKPSESASATAIGPSSTVVAESERTWVISAAAVNITSRIGSVGQSWTSGSRPSASRRAVPLCSIAMPSGITPAILTDRQSVVEGKSVSVRVDVGGRRIIQKKKRYQQSTQQYKI